MSTTGYDTRLRRFVLGRLQFAAERRREKSREIAYLRELGVLVGSEGESHSRELRMLDRAIYSMYLDCLQAGVSEEARGLLDELRQAVASEAVAI